MQISAQNQQPEQRPATAFYEIHKPKLLYFPYFPLMRRGAQSGNHPASPNGLLDFLKQHFKLFKETLLTGNAVHFGAGSIGRGFLGQIYCESGYHTTFIDVVAPVVDEINERKTYPLYIVSDAGLQSIQITNIGAVNGRDHDAAIAALATADIASTAVGLHALPHIAPVIAGAVTKRFERADALPLDIILCENLKNGQAHMRELVAQHLPETMRSLLEEKVGFVEASIGRMVPVVTEEQRAQDMLAVWVEPYCELPVDAQGFRGAIPPLKYLKPSAKFDAYVERKLFVHNLTHAAAAYLGYRRGYTFLYEAMRNHHVREKVEAAGRETCAALAKKHSISPGELEAHLLDLMQRYQNRALADQIARIGRDPVRKLGPEDRLIGAMLLCENFNIPPKAVAVAVGAAILYDHPDDPAAQELQTLMHKGGIDAVLQEVCRLRPDSTTAESIRDAVNSLLSETKEFK